MYQSGYYFIYVATGFSEGIADRDNRRPEIEPEKEYCTESEWTERAAPDRCSA